MRLYRIARREYINDLSGTGARLYGGRWNSKGTSLLYFSENKSLPILEVLVHLDGLTIPENLCVLTVVLSDRDILDFPLSSFKRIRNSHRAEYEFKERGEEWIRSKKSLGLKVPSVITISEFNILVNPYHKNINEIKIVDVEDLVLDARFFHI